MGQSAFALDTHRVPYALLVEDSVFDQKRVARIFNGSLAMQLVTAASLAEARNLILSNNFDIIVLDNALPDGLGVDFAAELRKKPGLRDIPILMVSDYPTPFVYDKAAAARVSMVISKDEFEPRHVRRAMRFTRLPTTAMQPTKASAH